MIMLMKKLWHDRRGNVLLIAGAALPLLVGAAGLATDTIHWAVWKRQLQRAADSAAFAGVYARTAGDSASAAVAADLNNNNNNKNQSGVSLKSGYPVISYPTSSNYTNGVKVDLGIQKRLGFSSLFLSTPPTIKVSATAGLIDQGDYCVWALRRGGGPAITIGGSSNTALGCNALSNSSARPAVAVNGTAYNFTAPELAAVGSLPSAVNGVDTLKPNHMVMPDPFEGKYPTNIPAGMSCGSLNSKRTGNNNIGYTLQPGCYNGNFKLTGSYTLQPGTYYLDSTDFDTTGGATVKGDGVTIIFTGNNPGSIATNGNSTIQLSAPTTGTYAKMLFIQAANATLGNNNLVNGNNVSSIDGAMYFPRGQVSFTGNSGVTTQCAMVVGYTVVFTGNTNLQNKLTRTDGTPCTGNTTVKGKAIKLVA